MTARTTHFKVGNGDMTLVETESGRKILVDINIRQDEEYDDDRPDVETQLRDRLTQDDEDRLYVDAFLLTHPDQDHCRGLQEHFHLGPEDEWSEDDDKILIREMWSSPIVFRRKSKNHTLCEDAAAWAKEARRRVKRFRDGYTPIDGERILILGEDEDGKTDDLEAILVRVDESFSVICGEWDSTFTSRLIAPLQSADAEDEDDLSKNDSSIVMNMKLKAGYKVDAAKYLFGGDAEVGIWERIWDRYKDEVENLEYDVLISPHHCSWHTLSWDSWSEKGEDAEVSEDARNALSQTRDGATVISSSKEIQDDDDDPPCIRAKREYEDIVDEASGEFTCLADLSGPDPLELDVSAGGPRPVGRKKASSLARPAIAGAAGAATGSSTALGSQPFRHG